MQDSQFRLICGSATNAVCSIHVSQISRRPYTKRVFAVYLRFNSRRYPALCRGANFKGGVEDKPGLLGPQGWEAGPEQRQ